VAEGRVKPDVLADMPDLTTGDFEIARDIMEAIKASPQAWRNFRRFSGSYQRIRIGFIEAARKRPAEFRKRLAHFVQMTEKNKRFGFGGIEAYFEDAGEP